MAKLKGTLTNINEILGPVPIVGYWNGGVCVQYGTGGSGTVVLEVTADDVDTIDKIPLAQWTAIQMKNPNDIAGAPISSLAAAGLGVADIVAYRGVRIRKSVAGTGGVDVTLVVGVG